MRTRITCCRDCKLREPGCHGVCELYQTEKAEMALSKVKVANDKSLDCFLTHSAVNRLFTAKKRSKSK